MGKTSLRCDVAERAFQATVVAASQRVAPTSRTMTGSAKQSVAPQSNYGLLRRYAPRQ